MKQLTCEMCGSTDLLKQDGVFVCQTCGTKYSVEDAKKMMIEGTVNVSGTVKVDNTDKINNYLEMAEAASDAGNNQEAESYCNKVIEIEPANYLAWMIKGKAAAWQSTLQNSRVDEGVAAFVKAIYNAPDDDKEVVIEYAKEQIKGLSSAMISIRADRFSKWPDLEETNGLLYDIKSILQTVVEFLNQTGASIPYEEFMAPIAGIVDKAVTTAWQKVIWPEYVGDHKDYSNRRPGKYEWDTFIKRVGFCTNLLEYAISFCDEDDEADITRYENLIFIHDRAINSCSWNYTYRDGVKDWRIEWSLTEEAKNVRRKLISEYEAKIVQCKAKVKEKKEREAEERKREQEERNEAYWAEHAEEKQKLEAERDSLQVQLQGLQSQMAPYDEEVSTLKSKREGEVPSEKAKETVLAEISKLRQEQGKLGIFKGKEKKALQTQINELNKRLSSINESIETERKEHQRACNLKIREIEEKAKPVKDKITATQERIDEIKAELTKNR